MSVRARWILIAVLAVLAFAATGVVGIVAWQQYQARQQAPSDVEIGRAHV